MSCNGNNGHGRRKTEGNGRSGRDRIISSANFTATFVNNTTSKFCTRFINGCDIDVTRKGCGIELKENWTYLVSYSYTLETEKCGSLEIIPVLNGSSLCNEKSMVNNTRDGKITASATFTLETDCFSILSFRFCANEAETGECPRGQISIVSLGRSCNNGNRNGSGSERNGCGSDSDGCGSSRHGSGSNGCGSSRRGSGSNGCGSSRHGSGSDGCGSSRHGSGSDGCGSSRRDSGSDGCGSSRRDSGSDGCGSSRHGSGSDDCRDFDRDFI